MMDLSSDALKLEAELERTINSDLEIHLKVEKIKTLLKSIVANEASIGKFNNMITDNNNNNLKEK